MKTKKYRIYLDVCCLNRPFDNLADTRVRIEADAVLAILSKCDAGEWSLLTSDVIESEMAKQRDVLRLQKVNAFLSLSDERLTVTDAVAERAEAYQGVGVKVYDSYHIALADGACADAFLTTDDRLLKKARAMGLNAAVDNPASWILEVI